MKPVRDLLPAQPVRKQVENFELAVRHGGNQRLNLCRCVHMRGARFERPARLQLPISLERSKDSPNLALPLFIEVQFVQQAGKLGAEVDKHANQPAGLSDRESHAQSLARRKFVALGMVKQRLHGERFNQETVVVD